MSKYARARAYKKRERKRDNLRDFSMVTVQFPHSKIKLNMQFKYYQNQGQALSNSWTVLIQSKISKINKLRYLMNLILVLVLDPS